MLILFQVSDNFSIHSLVLKRSVQYNEYFGCNGPVVQVRNVSLEDELKGTDRADLILMFAIETLQQI